MEGKGNEPENYKVVFGNNDDDDVDEFNVDKRAGKRSCY